MARVKVGSGIKEYTRELTQLYNVSREQIGEAVYQGAKIIADAVKREIYRLPVAQVYAKGKEKLKSITTVQRKGLLDGFGIAKMRDDGGYYNVKLGFAGYNGQKTHQWPNGQPNSMIARSVVAGSSFRAPNNFIRRAMTHAAEAEQKMKTTLDKSISQIFK